eukprot:scaffold76839_cov57-Phaeocystis_antarctica.AAC.3
MHVVCTWYARGTHAVSTGCAHGARPRGALAHGMHTGVHTSTWMCVSMPMLRVGVGISKSSVDILRRSETRNSFL